MNGTPLSINTVCTQQVNFLSTRRRNSTATTRLVRGCCLAKATLRVRSDDHKKVLVAFCGPDFRKIDG